MGLRLVGVHILQFGDDNDNECGCAENYSNADHPDTKLVLIESGGDNLSATFSPELVDAFIFVIDVAEGDKISRKGGPAIRYSDLLIINKTDLAPLVDADLGVMDRDAKKMRKIDLLYLQTLRPIRGWMMWLLG